MIVPQEKKHLQSQGRKNRWQDILITRILPNKISILLESCLSKGVGL